MIPVVGQAQDQPFDAWMAQLKEEARREGISARILEQAFDGVELNERIVELDRKQPESTMSMHQYLNKVVTQQRIHKARALYQQHRSALKEVGARYGVQPKYIVALWGIESNFGERMGNFSVVEALATLAYDGRRSQYFRGELLKALTILEQGHVAPGAMEGSWAGAMGQCQFMPSSFLRYAVDANRDGRKDIWNDEYDVFASIANYLSSEGWDGQRGLGTQADKSSNFNVLLKWNRSRYFATAVGKLADEVY